MRAIRKALMVFGIIIVVLSISSWGWAGIGIILLAGLRVRYVQDH
jgi:hypothetical protein